jgi:hypothetical protein
MAETLTERPEREMIRRALVPSAAALCVVTALAWILSGPGAGVSAAIGAAVVFANFSVHAWSLGRASKISIPAVHAVALIGPVVRLGIIVGLMFALNTLPWFSVVAFGLTVVPLTLLLLAFEARLAIRGTGAQLQIPADPAAARAADARAAREAQLDAR